MALPPDSPGPAPPDTRPNPIEGGVMSQHIEKTEDIAALWIGGAIFTFVAAVTAAVMAIGYGAQGPARAGPAGVRSAAAAPLRLSSSLGTARRSSTRSTHSTAPPAR